MNKVIISTDNTDKQQRIEQILNISPLPVSGKLGGSHTLKEKWYAVTRREEEVIKEMRPDDNYDLSWELFGGPIWGNIMISYSRRGMRESGDYLPTESYCFPEGTTAYTKVTVTGVNNTQLTLFEGEKGWSALDFVVSTVDEYFGKRKGVYGYYAYDPVKGVFLPRLPFKPRVQHRDGLNAIYEEGKLIGFDYQLHNSDKSRDLVKEWQKKLHSDRDSRLMEFAGEDE